MAKIWSNMHKVGSKDSVSNLYKYVLFHKMDKIPFDLPHTVHINILRNMKALGGVEDIYSATLINKLL